MTKMNDIFTDVCLVILIEIRGHQIGFEMTVFTSPFLLVVGQRLMIVLILDQMYIDKCFTLKKSLIVQLECAFLVSLFRVK